MERDSDGSVRRAQRVLLMVHELHKLGYQRVRIAPDISASGMHWRCSITHAGNIQRLHGALMCEYDSDVAHYTTGQDNNYFGWEDARQDTARQLAAKFVKRFPNIVRLGKGADWPYAGWYVQMLGVAERGAFPLAYPEGYSELSVRWMPTTAGYDSELPMPPAGEGGLDAEPAAAPDGGE